jgi:hypothetical protein
VVGDERNAEEDNGTQEVQSRESLGLCAYTEAGEMVDHGESRSPINY